MKLNSSVMNYNPKSALKTALTCALTSVMFSSFSAETVKDSIGLKREGGKSFVLYKVAPKQTLFSIVKRYGSSVAEFKAANPGVSESVQVGQTIKIPYKGYVVATAPVNKSVPSPPATIPTPTESVKMVSHVVESGQGLYSIATKYKVTMADVRKWNNLTTDQLTAGQVLIVDAREYERAKKAGDLPAKGEVVKVEDTNLGSNVINTKPTTEPDVSDAKTSSETSKTSSGYKKTIETGLAELIDVEDKSGKYLALHRSAPIGTLVNVKNSSNGQSIWVKVVGKLPDIGSDKVIIKLSPRAFEKLNPSDKRIRAEISYMTP
ncbi:LysM peptidoglycan-binding domain-containing protein [Arcicella sp. LKC2W]|uniref:LysM peptidoglycan-binding domain-containing protein n=1 Tax=Arcicella sp. LKC2W TaxID=2984198 RepID=UPI002B2034FE|nr:LysM peptidoglycan-binding domain-containing protein [Arcicella sp. LKC2W]MEA5459759.1 LysM peptidoglycan-binding domain-containing protein [Arcicella sp. LKC2W]